MSVINRLEASNCINLDNYQPNHKDWSPHFPYVEMNFRGLSAAIKATNGTGKTTLNNAFYALITRDRSMVTKFKSRMAPKRKGVWSHFRLELLYKTPKDDLNPDMYGPEVDGEAWVFGMYGYSDDEAGYYCYRGRFDDCPLAVKDGHKRSLIQNGDFLVTLKPLPDANSTLWGVDWKKAIGRHIDESLTRKMLAYHKAGGGDGTDNFFKVDKRAGEDFDTAFFYSHIAPETLVDCMGSYGDEDEHGFEDTLLKSAKAILDAKHSVEKTEREIKKLSKTHGILSSAKDYADQHHDAQESLANEARAVLAEYHFLSDCTTRNPLPLLPISMEHNSLQTQLIANAMVLQDGEWFLPDYALAEITSSTSSDIRKKAINEKLRYEKLKSSQVVEIPRISFFPALGERGPECNAYRLQESLSICQKSELFAEGWSQDAARRAINYAWDWRSGDGEHNVFRKLRQETEAEIKALGRQIHKDDSDRNEKTQLLQSLNSEIQEINQAAAALSSMRKSGCFQEQELANPSATGEAVQQELHEANQVLADLDERHVTFEVGRQAHARVINEFKPKSPQEAKSELSVGLANAQLQLKHAKQTLFDANSHERLTRERQSEAQGNLDRTRNQKGEIDLLVPHMRRFESLFPREDPTILLQTVPEELSKANNRKAEITILIEKGVELADRFLALAPGVADYRDVFCDEVPQGLAEHVTRALSDAEHELVALSEKREQTAEFICSLKDGQSNLRKVFDRFGENISLNSLEFDLERQEYKSKETLMQLDEDITRMGPLVKALSKFERSFPGTNPIGIEQQREARRGVVVIETNELKIERDIAKNQKSDLKSFGTAAGKIASKALECVGGNPTRVHQVIEGMDLTPERKQAVTTHFSHVLHSPVYKDPLKAKEALESLSEAGLEVPVFNFDGLERLCRDGELSWSDDQACGILIGTQTLQVKAIIDPSYIPDLIHRLQKKMADIDEILVSLDKEFSELSPDSEQSKLIRDARQAVESGARGALDDAITQKCQMEEKLKEIRNNRSEEIIRSIRLAGGYIEAGGDDELNLQSSFADQLEKRKETLNLEMPELKRRASKKALSAIHSMQDYVELGGQEGQEHNTDALRNLRQEAVEIEEKLPKLQSRFDQFSVITKAKDFVDLGGWEKAKTLNTEIAQVEELVEKAEEAVATAIRRVNVANDLVEVANTQLFDISNADSLWKSDLQRAIQFEQDGGMSFDATYGGKRQSARIAVSLADKRSRFQFSQAQQAAEAEGDPLFRENKVKQRDELGIEITHLNTRITDCRQDQEKARQEVEQFRVAASKVDAAVKSILDQWNEVREIMEDLPQDQRGEMGTDNIYVEDSRRAVSDIWDAFDEERWTDALDELEGLAENSLQFPLSRRRSSIKELSRGRQQALKQLKKEVKNVLDTPDNGLSESEIEALANPRNEEGLSESVLNLHRIIENHLIKAENRHELNQKDVEENKHRMLASMAGFTDMVEDNFSLLKRVLSTRGGGASIKVSGDVISATDMRAKLDKLVEEIDIHLSRRKEDIESGRISKESEQVFHDRLRCMIRSEFYRAAFRAPESSNAAGPTVTFSHPHIGGGRDIPLSKNVSTGQFNALTLLILVKLADFSMRRDARNDYNGMTISRSKRISSARTVMIDGLFSNLSNRKMIRESLDVLRSLQGSFQLIGWIHNEQYENDFDLFPSCSLLRRTGIDRGYVLAEEVDSLPMDTDVVVATETHILPKKSSEDDDE